MSNATLENAAATATAEVPPFPSASDPVPPQPETAAFTPEVQPIILDARARMIESLKKSGMSGPRPTRTDYFNELRDAMVNKGPSKFPAVIDGKKVIGRFKYYGPDGIGLAGDQEVGEVWFPLHREYCASRPELKHITNGFNHDGFYQYEDSLFGYCIEEEWEKYNEALSYNKPNQIQIRMMRERFKDGIDPETGHVQGRMKNAPAGDHEAVEKFDFTATMVGESEALQMAQMGLAAKAGKR